MALSGSSFSHENLPWDDNIDLFGLKISWDVARAFLTVDALVVLPPDFLYIGNNSNHDIGGPFGHFSLFFFFKNFDDIICSNNQEGIDPNVLSTNSFILADFLQPWRVW